MTREGWIVRENLVAHPSVDHWGEIGHASFLWEFSLRDVPGRFGLSCCQRNHEKSELKAVINLYRKFHALLLL